MKKMYMLEDLDCANCAAKMEEAISKIDGVTYARVSYLAQKLTLEADDARYDDILALFNAETFIIGLCSGVMGIVLSEILLIPGNMLIRQVSGSDTLTAILPLDAAAFLIVLATLLTILAGLIPAMGAAKSNPVKALRSE